MVGISSPGAQTYEPGTIHEAVSACNLAEVKALVEEGLRQEKLAERTYTSGLRAPLPAAFVDDVDERGVQAIHIAAGLQDVSLQDQIALIDYLLENGADPNETNTEDGLSPLHIAAERNNVDVVVLLLENDADATIEDRRAMTALHLAANRGYTDVVQALVTKAPSCIGLRRCKGNTALHYTAAHGHFDATLALLHGGAKTSSRNNMGATPLHFAAGRGYKGIAEALVEFGADLDEAQNDGCTPLHFAAMEGHLDVLDVLHAHNADLEMKTEKGATALHCAAERGYMEILTALLEYGADVNAMQNSGNTPLMYAAAKGHDKVVRALLGAEADPNHAGDNGSTPVHRAVANDMLSIVKILLQAKADLNRETLSGETPLFHAAAQGNLDMVQFLLDQNADVNSHVNNGGDTPLHLACTQGNKQVVMAFIEHGARLDIVNNEGCNPLQKGQYKLDEEIPQYLAYVKDEEGRTLLWSLVSEMTSEEHNPLRVEALRVLISDMLDYNSDPNACVADVSVLDAALAPGGSFDYDTVKMLVDHGAACDRGFPLNRVVRELTQCRDDIEREEFLLDCIDILAPMVDVNANAEGNTPLLLAINAHHSKAVHRLAQAGADINSGNIIGKLCKQLRNLSEEPGQEEQLQFLGESIVTVVEAGADVNACAGKIYMAQKGPLRTLSERYEGNSCLEHCVSAGHEEACKAIISHGADLSGNNMLNKVVEEMCEIDPNRIPPGEAANPSAARYGVGRMEFLRSVFHEMVAQPGTDLDAEWEGKTALRRAVEDVHDDLPFGQEAVATLLDAGANPNKNHVFFWTVHNLCHIQPASGPRHEALFKIVKMLIMKKDEEGNPIVDVNQALDNQTPLALSWTAGNQQVVELLTENGAKLGASTLYDVMAALVKDPYDEFSNRISASIIADISNRKLTKRSAGASINYVRKDKTPLILGIMARHEDLVLGANGLFPAGADANICAPFNFCLDELRTCKPEDRDFLEKVALHLLERQADVDAGNRRGFRQAVQARSYIAFVLVQERKAVHNDLFDVLHDANECEDEEERDYLDRLAMALISAGMGIKIMRDGETALTLSIMSNNIRFIEMLLEKKCNLHDAYPFHKTLKEMPKANGDADRLKFLSDVLDKLLAHSDSVNEILDGDTPLTCAIKSDARTFTGKLLNYAQLDYNLCSPLVVALNEVNRLCELEDGSEDVDRMDFLYNVIFHLLPFVDMTSGSETLIKAINTGRVDLVKRMVDAGADVNFLVPLAHCLSIANDPTTSAERRHAMTRMAMLLLVNGANPNVMVGKDQLPALTVAAMSGDLELTTQLIMHNPNLESFDELDQQGRPALHRFLYWLKETDPNNQEKVAFWEQCCLALIKHVSNDSLNTLVDGYSPLDVALNTNNAAVCSALLNRGASFGPSALIDRLNELNQPELEFERIQFLEETACELIANGADVNQAVGGVSPLDLVFKASSGRVLNAMVDHQLAVESKNAKGQTVAQFIAAEIEASEDGHRLNFLSDAALSVSKRDASVFHEVLDINKGSPKSCGVAVRLLEQDAVSPDAARESDGASAMHAAASAGVTDIVRILLGMDSDPNAVNMYNQTPLALAALAGHFDVVSMLLDARANPAIAGGQFLTKMTPLHEAALIGDPDICQALIDAGAPVDATAYWQRTPLHLAVVGGADGEEETRLPCVQVLLSAKCDVNAMDLDDETGLSYAVERNYHSISNLLLSKGADPCGADIHGDTPVHHCVENHNNDIFQDLIKSKPHELEVLGLLPPVIRAGFRPGIEPLAQPCGEITTAESLNGMIGRANIGGWLAPLWNACYFGQPGTAESILNQVIDMNLKDHAGFTLLHRLVHWGQDVHVGFITTLLRKGASPDVRDRNNWTPLQVAARLGNAAAARALRTGGAVASEDDIRQAQEAGFTTGLLTADFASEPAVHDRANLDNARSWSRENNAKWVDTTFRPTLKSLVNVEDNTRLPGRYHDVEWVRAGEACSGSFLGAFDVTAGPLGDPFFIATMPDDPASAFPEPESSEHGVYEVHINYMNQQHVVLVDDFVPAIDGKPISACSASGMMWPLIYEKACAKVAGSYQALSALRHGESVTENLPLELPSSVASSARVTHEIQSFLAPCLAAARTAGFTEDLGRFAEYFSETAVPENMLEGLSRPMATVGTFDMMDFSLRAPSKIVKVNVDTAIRVECSYNLETAGKCRVAVCVAEMTNEKWRLMRGSVSVLGQTSVVVEATLEATGNRYLVFVGTPENAFNSEQELNLEILADQENVEILDA